jgi:predicted anti-sigma-YlaC factor YlaD
MTCQDHKDLMMAYLDDELDDEQRRAFEAHLASCGDCAKDLEEFKKLKQITDGVQLVEPEDRIWDEYWSRIYNRIERGTGWILFSVAAIALLIYGGFELIETVIENRTVGVLAKVGLAALVAGGAILFVSVLRERIHFWSRDRYKDVRR